MGYNKYEVWARTGKGMAKKKKISRLRRLMFRGKNSVKCEYCKRYLSRENATFDHVVPQSKGGYHKQKNGALACKRCNNLKGSMTKGTFLQAIREGRIVL